MEGSFMQKKFSEMASYIKKLLPANIPEVYSLKPMIKNISSEKNIRNGVLSFRDFMHKLYDRLIADSSLYEKPLKKMQHENADHVEMATLAVGYPFIFNVTIILANIGYYGKLSKNGNSILLDDWQSFTYGELARKNVSISKVFECLRFLVSCGLHFSGVDLDVKKIDISKIKLLEISYPDSPNMLIGLKVMAVAHRELATNNDYYVFQRCDYRILKNETCDVNILIKDYVYPLSANVRDFILKLHQRYVEAGLVCKMKMHYFNVIFSYSYKSNVVWDYMPSPDGCYIFTKAKNMDKYTDVIKKFPLRLRKKISRGYGCEKKMFGEPCQKGCHGFSFLLDDSILDISNDIQTWLDNELLCLKSK